jgi:S-adenosylmethionine decarboxylase
MRGLHLTADLSGCRRDQAALTQPEALRALCFGAVRKAGLQAVGHCYYAFEPENGEPRGVTCVVLLAESHVAVHTWPELDAVTLDVYVCHRRGDHSAKAQTVIDALVAAFAPATAKHGRLERG